MPYYCTVPRCTSMAGKAKNVSFHQFPRDEELAKLWNKILKRGKPYTKYSKVCSLHFTAEDYTITSVGKNKGQWRTLRKDAIPSQNLPSESPTPYQRKQWSSWSHSPAPNVIEPTLQQQVAQAIYMQTMLAMQAAGPPELTSLNPGDDVPLPLATESYAHTSTAPDTDILKGKQTNTEQNTSYKCTECSKCFKDPDVFILHKRTHIKNEKNEKENFNLNVTLQANPILANLLKTNPENSNIFDNNLMSMESLFMTALAANMEGYMRNFTSMIKGQQRDEVGHDRGEYDHNQGESDHNQGESDHNQGESDHDRGESDHDGNNTVDHDGEIIDNGESESDHEGDLNDDPNNVSNERTDYTNRGNYEQNSLDLRLPYNRDCQSMALKLILDHDRIVSNHGRISMTHSNGDIIFDRSLNQNRDNPKACDSNVFQNSLLEHISSNAQSVRYHENKDLVNGSSRNGDVMANYDQSVINHEKVTINYDRSMKDHDEPLIEHEGITNGDDVDSHGSNTEPNCDSGLNESIDSNKLVIDEIM